MSVLVGAKRPDPTMWLRAAAALRRLVWPADELGLQTRLHEAVEAGNATAVDRLLASPEYAERWAAVWLDLARYADSSGHGSDPLRTIWRYRDWVITSQVQN